MPLSPQAARADLPARSLKERQRDERAALILQAAQDLLVEKGYHAMSIDEIATRVGIAKGTVYLHFASKEALVEALFQQEIVSFLAAVEQAAAEPASARARLEQILSWTYHQLCERRGQVLQDLNRSTGMTRRLIDQHAELRANITQVIAQITAVFAEGQRRGELRPAPPASIMAATFLSLLSNDAYEELLTSGQLGPADLVTSVSAIFFRGIATPDPPDS